MRFINSIGIFLAVNVVAADLFDLNEKPQRILTPRGSLPDEIGLDGMPYHELHYKKEQCGDAQCTVSATSIFSNFNQSLPSYEWFVRASNAYGLNIVSAPRKKATAMLMAAVLLMCKKGDIVETGVFTGGSTALMMKYLIELDQCGRKFYIFDSFEGLPDAVKEDSVANGLNVGEKVVFFFTQCSFCYFCSVRIRLQGKFQSFVGGV